MSILDKLMHPHSLPKYSGAAIATKPELQEGTYLNAGDVYDAFESLRPHIRTEVDELKIELADVRMQYLEYGWKLSVRESVALLDKETNLHKQIREQENGRI